MQDLSAILLAHLEQEATALYKLTERMMNMYDLTFTPQDEIPPHSSIEPWDVNR